MPAYIPGHGYVGSAQNIAETQQGYDEGLWGAGDDRQFTYNEGGWYDDNQGYKYDMAPATGFMGGDGSQDTYYRRRNDALNTTRNRADLTSIAGWNNTASDNYDMTSLYEHPDWVNQMDGRIKTGDKVATRLKWTLNPETNTWDPQITGREGWDTNADERMRLQLAIAMATAGVGAYLAPAAAAAGAAGTAGEVGAGVGYGLVDGAAVGATGLENAAWMGGAGAGGGYGGAAGATGGWMDTAKQAYDMYKTGNQIYKGYNTLSSLFGGGEGQAGGAGSQRPGGAGGGSGMADLGFLNNLFNMGGANYSANMNDNYADEMRNQQAKLEAERRPYVERLNNSYLNPNEYLQGAEGQAIQGIETNRLGRLAARGGTNANPTDRDRLLQAHMMKNLEGYRGGLRSDLQQFDQKHIQDMFLKQAEMERMKNSPLFAGAAYGAGGGQGTLTPQMIEILKKIPGGLDYINQLMGNTGGSVSPLEDPSASFGMGNRSEDFIPGADTGGGYVPDYSESGPGDVSSDWFNDSFWGIE